MIELLPAEVSKDSNTNNYHYLTYITGIGMVVLLIIGSFYLLNLLKNLKQKREKLNYRLQELKGKRKELQQKIQQVNQYRKLRNIDSKISYARIIKDLNLIIPLEVWVTKFTLNNNKVIKLKGKSSSNQKLIITLRNLDKYPYFKDPKLISSNRKENEMIFQITGRIVYGEK